MSDQAGKEEAMIGHETEGSIAENDKISKDSDSKLQVAINTLEKINKAQVEIDIDRDSPAKLAENNQAVISRASSPSHFEDNEEDEAQNTDEKVQDKRISPQSSEKYSNYDFDHKNNGTLKPIEDEPKLQTPENELDNTTSQEKELTDILVDAAFKKSCPDHKQMIVTICTDFSCPKRFWCGICCVKSKDLYVRFSAHMTLISDFLEESIAKLYKVKTFTDVDKKSVDTQLKNIVAKNEANFEETWKLIDGDIEAYKREIVSKIDWLKSGVKDRFNRSVKTINIFYDELADTIQTSKTRDMSHELEELKSQVSSGIKDALEAIESIGNKVNVDIYDVETLNSEFDKSRDFISFIHNNYDSIKENTIPAYISMEKSASALAEKVETLSQPKIKALLDDSHKDLTELRLYYEGMLTNDVPKEDQEDLLNEYLQRRQEPDYHRDPVPRDVDESPHSKPKPSRPDRKMQNTMREADKKIPTSGRERAVDHTSSLRDQRGQIQPIKSTQGSQGNKLLNVYSSYPANQMIGSEMIDIQDSNTPQDSQFKYYYDGALCPQYNEFEFESIEREGSIPLSTEGKDFTPVLYLHNNTYLVSSFQKRDTSMSPSQILYGFKIFWVADDPKSFGGSKANLVYSSDALFMSTSKINHITVIERESDGLNLICVNREDGYIYILNYFINEDNEFLMELENTIVPQTYEGQITSLRRLGGSDFLVCTNTRGEILTFDTVRCEMISAEKICDGAVANACFVQENSYYLIASGSTEGSTNDNSLTFLNVNFMKDKKQFGTEVPTFKYKVRVKKAHGDKFGVLAVSADNAKNAPLIFSAGGMDDPCIKIWNFESKELISTIDAKDMYANIFMNLIVSRQNPGGNLISSLDTSQKEPKGAWKSRVEELPSYKRLRDEKKRKKTSGPEDTGQHFILLCLTTSCIRVLKVVIRQKNKAEVRENTVAIDSKSRMANSIMQISKSTEESFTVFASDGVGKVQIFAMKLNVS